MDPIVVTAKNGVNVRITDLTIEHMAAHPIDISLLTEAISQAEIGRERSWGGSVDLGRVLGCEDRIEVPAVGYDDFALFALRRNRPRPSHVVIDRQRKETSSITLIANRFNANDDTRTLISAWYGTLAMPEPRGSQSKLHLEFWSRNALLWVKENYVTHPFVSTWRRVLTNRWQQDAKLSGENLCM
jgi:hypothetical protein